MAAILVGVAMVVIFAMVVGATLIFVPPRRAQPPDSSGRHELEGEDWPEYGHEPP